MKIELPKDMRSFAFPEMTVVELNDTVVERMIGHIFEMAIKNGRTSTSVKHAAMYTDAKAALASHPKMSGFESEYHRAALDALLRSTVVVMGKAGQRRSIDQMQYLYPTNIAVYRAGFPSRSRHRQADVLVYREMLAALEARPHVEGDARKSKLQLSDLFRGCFGAGVEIGESPRWEPKYDGKTSVDVSSLLSLYFLEHFEAKSAKNEDLQVSTESPIPAATRPIGREVIEYIEAYGSSTSPRVLTGALTALIGLRLFQLPLRTGIAVRELMESGELPLDMIDDANPNALEQYVDFTGVPDSSSVRMAQACVQRDMAIITRSFTDRLVLKWIAEAAEALRIPTEGEPRSATRLKALAALQEEQRVSDYLSMQLLLVSRENQDSEDEETQAFLERIGGSQMPSSAKLGVVLTEALRKRGYENAIKWFWSTGGISTEVGVLTGSLKVRQSWTYAPKDALLTALLASLFVMPRRAKALPSLRFEQVLSLLESRFGLLIARPPSDMNDAANRAAAEQNLEAFKRRLQLLGVFDGLSDDFSAQRVRNPMGEFGDIS